MRLDEALAVAQGHGGSVGMWRFQAVIMDQATTVSYRNGIDEAEGWQYGVDAAGISRRAFGDVKQAAAAANELRWGLAYCG